MIQLEIISRGYRKNTIHIMSPNLPITFLTKLDLLENQNEVKDSNIISSSWTKTGLLHLRSQEKLP